MIPEYVARLCEELEKTAQIAHELNLRLESVYIGGGTPTTLTWEQMELLLRTIRRNFDFSCCREFTVAVSYTHLDVYKRQGGCRA